MEIAKLILDYIKTLVWPIVVMASVFLFRKKIESLIDRIKAVKFREFSAELGEVMISEARPKATREPLEKIELAVSTGGYSEQYRAIFLVVGIANREGTTDQIVSWQLSVPSLGVELEPTPAPPNLVPGVPWWESPLIELPPNKFVQGSLFFKGKKTLQDGLPQEPLAGRLLAKTLRGRELSRDVMVYRLSTLQANPSLDRYN
jgi:hypothetical protein